MDTSLLRQSVFAITLLSLGISVQYVSSDTSSVLATYSGACQKSIKAYSSDFKNICSNYGIWVKLGFCTENEFNNFTVAICNGSYTEQPDSEAKTNFYAAVNNVSQSCLNVSLYCFQATVISKVLKQQEQYCSLMKLGYINGSTNSCLKSGVQGICISDEVDMLQSAACVSNNNTNANQTFSVAVLSTSIQCQSRIDSCGRTFDKLFWPAFLSENYCEFFNGQYQNLTLNSCLTEGGACNETELNMLITSACGEVTPNVTAETTTPFLTTEFLESLAATTKSKSNDLLQVVMAVSPTHGGQPYTWWSVLHMVVSPTHGGQSYTWWSVLHMAVSPRHGGQSFTWRSVLDIAVTPTHGGQSYNGGQSYTWQSVLQWRPVLRMAVQSYNGGQSYT
ncbi:hypothetical protein Btru_019788 [Bulinus truncatus]|nr:hypothetical protein Btru_019788 [Bulinus truncatus]